MKDKYKIIKEEFDTITGITTVIINTDCGAFTGSVKLDNIDAQYPSIYHANELALSKALRKYAKQMIIITREKIKTINAIQNQCYFIAQHSPRIVYGQATCLMQKEKERLKKELDLWNKRIEVMTNTINQRIAARDKIVKTYLDKNK